MNIREIYIYLLIISAFISISVFEVFVVIALLWTFFDFLKKRSNSGRLKFPVLAFSLVSILSTILYVPRLISKGIEEGLFQLLYFFGINPEKKLIQNINYLFILIGIFLIPIIIYNYVHLKNIKPVWGGAFEIGQFYGMFSLISATVAAYYYKNNHSKKAFLFLFLSILFFGFLVFAHKRSPLLGFIIVSYLFVFILNKNKIIPKLYFVSLNVVLTFLIVSGYFYLSKTDYRFRLFNQVITGKKPLNYQTLDRIGSSRIRILMDGINVIKNDIKGGNILNLLIGHGVRSGYYLPHKYDTEKRPKYESIFIVSEFIEKGIIGLLAVLSIFYIAFKRFVTVKIRENFDLLALGIFFPFLIHLIGSIFTFFWDAILPLYLLLFKIGEIYFDKRND